MAENLGPRPVRAAGGVLWRAGAETAGEPGVEVAVVHRPRYDDWTFPKGKLSPGESEIDGAVREVLEETGYRVRVGRGLGRTRYEKQGRWGTRPKVVRYWAMEVEAGSFDANNEVDELRWLPLAEARELLSYERDREILEVFVRGAAVTGSVLLLRHASAGERSEWVGDDRLRPLDERGRLQSEALVRELSHFDVDAILSADFVRCTETVEPLADAVGLAVEEEPLLSELDYPGREEEAEKLVRTHGDKDAATVMCSQGGVIPDLIRGLAEADHVDLVDPLPRKKASTWVLSFESDRLFAADYIPPPAIED